MTISIHPTPYDACSICQESFVPEQKEDAKKVIELACHHFFHMQCLSSCFSQSESEGKKLSCDYCSQLWTPENELPFYLTEERFTALCREKRRGPLSEDDLDLIDIILKIDSLEETVKDFAMLSYKKWPLEMEEQGVNICYTVNEKVFKLCLSKEYIQRAVVCSLCERVQSEEQFEKYMTQRIIQYYYDPEILEAAPFAQLLYKEFAQLLQENSVSSVEEILSLLKEAVNKMERRDYVGKTASLIVHRFLFSRGALRTLPQEIKRWKKRPPKELPIIKDNDIRVLDPNDLTKEYTVKNFKELLGSDSTDNSFAYTMSFWLTTSAVAMVAVAILKKLS